MGPPDEITKLLFGVPQYRKSLPPRCNAGFLASVIQQALGTRFLELADLALDLKKPAPKKKKVADANIHSSEKTEPYSN
jgi:hypothetical protein